MTPSWKGKEWTSVVASFDQQYNKIGLIGLGKPTLGIDPLQ